jgi:hypothetical protein
MQRTFSFRIFIGFCLLFTIWVLLLSFSTVAERTGIDAKEVSMSKPFIREPGLVNRWLQGDRKPATRMSCNSCFKPGLEEGGIYCVVEKKEQEKAAKK